MHRLNFLEASAALFIALVILFVTGSIANADPPTGSISGTVLEDDGITPVEGAVIFVNDFVTGAAVANSTSTPAGIYTVSDLPTGTYRVHVNANDQGFPIQYYDGATTAEDATAVSVTDGSDTPDVDFSLPSGSSVSGTVYQEDGATPISNAEVWAESYDCCSGGHGTRTAGDGTYTIPGLVPGDYRVQASAADLGFAQEFYNDTNNSFLAARVTVNSSSTTPNIDFTLSSGGSISGTVVKDGGTPVANANVWAGLYDGEGGNGTQTAIDGTYTITGLAPGDYRVEVRAPGQGLAGEFYEDTTDWGRADRVTVTSGQTTADIDFDLASGGTISGAVVRDSDSSPVSNAWVWAENYVCCGGNGAQTAADGTYTITGLLPGDYRVQVNSPEAGLSGEFYNDTTDWGLAVRVAVTASSTTPNIDFSLSSGGSISGSVVKDSDGSVVANAWIWAENYDCCGGSGAQTAADGTYTINGLVPGDYRVQVQVNSQSLAGEFYDDTTDWGLAARVAVTADSTTADIDFALSSGGSISGTVYGADGVTPVANADVWADKFDCCGGGSGTRTAIDGTYTITGLSPGDYRVQVRVQGSSLAGEFYDDTTDWGLAARVAVTANSTTADIDFSLSSGGSISGTVYEADGTTPVANADVWADKFDCCGGSGTRTASDGTYTITGLTPGDYRVQVHVQGNGLAGEFYNDTISWDDADEVTVVAGQTTTDIDFSLAAGGSISGTVVKDSDGSPVANADVWANSYECCGGGNGTRTAADGTYTITGLAPGDYRVEVRVQGESLAGEFYDNTTDWNDADEVTVAAGQTTANIDFSLASGGSISGTVVKDSDGLPVAGANVWAESYDCCGGSGTRTASDGTYTINGLAPGDYRVQVHIDGQSLSGEFYNDTTDWGQADQVAVVSGQDTPDIDFSLAAGGSISGTVVKDSDGSPVAGADVWANSYECCGGGGARTSSDGTYTIMGLPAGEYRVEVYVQDGGLAGELYNDANGWDDADTVVVAASQTTAGVDFSLASGGSISGAIYAGDGVTPVAGANIWANDYDGGGGHGWARSNADGAYIINGLAPGNYRVEAEADGLVHKMYDNTTQWHMANPVSVSSGQDTPGIDFTLDSGGSITGTVYAADGVTPVVGAEISASSYDGDGGWGWAQSASDGTFAINGLASGDYRVQAGAPNQGLSYEYYNDTASWDDADRVIVTSGQTTSAIDFNLAAGGSISGTVYQADGVTPIADVDIWAENYQCCGGGSGTRTASDGTYTISGLAPGEYRVRADTPDQGLVSQFYDGTSDWGQATAVEVTASQTTTGIDFTLAAGGSISGSAVKDSDGSAVANAWVWAESYECCGGSGAQTAADGTYTITGLAPGNYRVQVQVDGQDMAGEFYNDTTDWNDADTVVVSAGETTTGINFSLAAGGSISGTVVQADGVTPIADVDIWAEKYECCGGGSGTRTASDGTYTISGLAPGEYRVQVNPSPEAGLVSQFYDGTSDWGQAAPVEVTASQTTSGIDFTLASGGSISGTVLRDSDSSPVANVWVQAESFQCCGGSGAQTNQDGTYTIAGLAPGDYRVQVYVDDLGLSGEFYDDAQNWEDAAQVTVTAGQTMAGIDFSLAAGGTISGTVIRDSDGSPVAGADVYAESVNCCSGSSARTEPDGTYTITGLVAGSYRVSASAPEQSLAGAFYNDVSVRDDATSVTVTAGQNTPNIDFSLANGGAISGTVHQADGVTPIEGAVIEAYQDGEEEQDGPGFEAITASDGTYTIVGLSPGQYFVEAEAGGFALELYEGAADFDSATPVTVNAGGEVSGIDFTLEVAGAISGMVTEDDGVTPIAEVEVFAMPSGAAWPPEEILNGGETGVDGTYTIEGLSPGQYRVIAIGAEAGFVMELYNGASDPQSATLVTVTAGQDTPNIDFNLAEGGSISGMAFEPDGVTPIGDVLLIAEEITTGMMLGEADSMPDGTYVIGGLPSGQYRVKAIDEFGLGFEDEYYNNATDEGSATPVNVAAPNDTTNINFTLDAAE